MLIIPAIDLIEGKCVRLVQGDFQRETVYSDDPIAVAQEFADQGAIWLHCVDLDGAKAGAPRNLDVLRRIAERCPQLQIEFGGGVRDLPTIRAVLDAGASRVVLGSALARSRTFAAASIAEYGDRIVAGIDTRSDRVAMHGWEELSELEGISFAQELCRMGCRRFIWTDIETDGMLQGPNLGKLAEWIEKVPAAVIASGGVSSIDDLVSIRDLGAEAAIVGKALFEKQFDLSAAISETA